MPPPTPSNRGRRGGRTPRRAATLAESLGACACLAILGALIIAGAARLRSDAMAASSLSQLRWIAGVTGSYGADFEDRLWSLSWQAGELPHSDPTLPATAFDGVSAIAIQAVDIMRRRGRPDMPVMTSWYAPVHYSHLPLLDYLDRDMPDRSFVAPADKHRLNWTKDPQELFDRGFWLPYQPIPSGGLSRKWPYSASYQSPPALVSTPISGGGAVRQSTAHSRYVTSPEQSFAGAPLSSVVFPAQKVMLHDGASWHGRGRPRFFADPEARPMILSVDGAARALATSDANPGWYPGLPTSSSATRVTYERRAWEPPTDSGFSEIFLGYYRFTRGGPAGRDFGGPEVDTASRKRTPWAT